MRRHRVALIIATYAVGIAAAIPLIISGGSAAPQSKEASWTSSHHFTTTHYAPDTAPPLETLQVGHQMLAKFAVALTAWQSAQAQAAQAAQAAAQAAAEQAAQAQAAASQVAPAPSPTTTVAPVIYSGSPESRAIAAGVPDAWVPTAVCEESGNDDPYAGFFGILEWNGYGGYPTAGSAPLSVQLGWEAAHGQGPPDAPGQCHSY